jgi:hypothetical protein
MRDEIGYAVGRVDLRGTGFSEGIATLGRQYRISMTLNMLGSG